MLQETTNAAAPAGGNAAQALTQMGVDHLLAGEHLVGQKVAEAAAQPRDNCFSHLRDFFRRGRKLKIEN